MIEIETAPICSAPLSEGDEYEISPENAPPRNLCCPITLDLMADPVIAMDGHTYERSAIELVLKKEKPVSPCTSLPLQNRTLIPNVAIRSMCISWREKTHAPINNNIFQLITCRRFYIEVGCYVLLLQLQCMASGCSVRKDPRPPQNVSD